MNLHNVPTQKMATSMTTKRAMRPWAWCDRGSGGFIE
jgi:hypothetical protein